MRVAGYGFAGVWAGTGAVLLLSADLSCHCTGVLSVYSLLYQNSPLMGASCMKIVVVRSPRFLSGILRLMFGIKKEN